MKLRDIRTNQFVRTILYPISVLYGCITDIRNFFYSFGLININTFQVPIISIGNLVAGGTGKTPLTMLCIDLLRDHYKQIVVVSRGYGRKSKGLQIVSDGNGNILSPRQGGDEPVMMAKKYPKVPVIVAENRTEGIRRAIDSFHADLILLDDAFQHRKVARNCDLVLIDSQRILSRERLLPAGDLREKLKNVRRATMILLNNSQGEMIPKDLELLNSIYNGPVFECHFQAIHVVNPQLEKIGDINILKDKSIYVMCAIARPQKFITMLSDLGAEIIKISTYPDHYFFTKEDYKSLKQEYQALNCDFLLTTEKDMVKLDTSFLQGLNLVALALKGDVKNPHSFVNKLRQFIDNIM